jgi:polysaccharide pyruvyl transferase WcaK-like protein
MNILITGVGPHNKGAELMLLAILDQLRRRLRIRIL